MTFELDHVFVAARAGAPEMVLLSQAGFVEAPPHDHPGQGTASRGVFFENAYLELIWLTEPAVADGPAIRRTRLAERTDPSGRASPFGFGLRSPEEPLPPAPFRTWSYRPPYLPEGAAFAMGANSEKVEEPMLFVLPWSRSATWSVPEHANGARRVTGVTLVHPSPCSEELEAFSAMGLVVVEAGPEPLLGIELDGGLGQELDLRPDLPLVVRW